MTKILVYELYDVVEMKKEHPCEKRSKKFQIIRVGADIKMMCLGCGHQIMMNRVDFNKRFKKVLSHELTKIEIK